jgi:predicted glycogen debranching enzyme
MSEAHLHRPAWVGTPGIAPRPLLDNEWLVTNGIGGYASGTVAGVMTRKYHGVLVAALPTPFGRQVMLQDLRATLRLGDGREIALSGEERRDGSVRVPSERYLCDFRLELGLPVWEFDVEGVRLLQRVVMPHGRNTVFVSFERRDDGAPAELLLRPFMHVRSYEDAVTTARTALDIRLDRDRMEISARPDMAPLRLRSVGGVASFTADELRVGEVAYRIERERGYEWVGEDWSPGYFTLPLRATEPTALVASTEEWATFETISDVEANEAERARRLKLLEISHRAAEDEAGELLVLAADQFIITPAGRVEDAARAAAAGEEVRSVIAGYHWFTDWGRDTMISLEGLALCTGRHREAAYILRTFAHYTRRGLIPNMFPDGATEGLYHTADATLWFFHAVHRYVQTTGDRATLREILPKLREIIDVQLAGTDYGIHVDPADGLLAQGAEGYQLTWMDAKVDGWVVTPRRGKAVEINALWYNALRVLETHVRDEGDFAEAARLDALAVRAKSSFNARFWNESAGCLYDIVDGEDGRDDPACRPNQIFAISLDHPVLDESRWQPVLDTVGTRLLTPVGLRSLAPGHPDYKARYFGDLRARDAAYHQGTVWGWLIGPWVDAWLRVHPDDAIGARRFLTGMIEQLDTFGVGSIGEIFDAEPPFAPRGCIAQAWSVAETLRAWRRSVVTA